MSWQLKQKVTVRSIRIKVRLGSLHTGCMRGFSVSFAQWLYSPAIFQEKVIPSKVFHSPAEKKVQELKLIIVVIHSKLRCPRELPAD